MPSVPRSHWGSGSRLLPRAPGSPVWVRLREDFFRIEFACAPSLGWVALRAQLRTAWHSFLRCGHKPATLYGLKQHRSPLSFSLFPRSEPSRGLPGGKPRCPQGSGRQSVPLPFLCFWRVWVPWLVVPAPIFRASCSAVGPMPPHCDGLSLCLLRPLLSGGGSPRKQHGLPISRSRASVTSAEALLPHEVAWKVGAIFGANGGVSSVDSLGHCLGPPEKSGQH